MKYLIVELSWKATVAAELRVLRDNAVELLDQTVHSDVGRLTLQWLADPLIAHHIDWELWAPGRKLEDLAALAAWEDGEPFDLAEKDDAQDVWRGAGDL